MTAELDGFDNTYKELSDKVKTKVKSSVNEEFDKLRFESESLKLRTFEYQQIIMLRDEWAKLFKAVLITILIFEIFITILVGLEMLDYSKYEWLINIIVIGGFTQILTMPFTVAKFLFSNDTYKR